MRLLVAADRPLREELWTVQEARAHFAAVGWDEVAKLLDLWRDAAVPLVSYGNVYALSPGLCCRAPAASTVSSDRGRRGPAADVWPGGRAALDPAGRRGRARGRRHDANPLTGEALAVSRQTAVMTAEHDRWLRTLGITTWAPSTPRAWPARSPSSST
jgi:hypothetical protein